ncbi:tetratricopeptide repeat protein [Pedobacter sp. SAFR-022]|uniref:tetratricopeptide repeat protein n=1 Tax=Pedobacter sp. SAFR-022 TaxID=3436861 RepID=UPI003F807DA9
MSNTRSKQIILVSAVLLLVVFLFTRDIKGLVKPKEDTTAAPAAGQMQAEAAEINLDEVSTVGKNLVGSAVAKEISTLENEFKTSNGSKKISLAASLAKKWDAVDQPVPSALYLEMVAQQEKTLNSWLASGEKLMKAFDNSRDSTLLQPLLQKANASYSAAVALDSTNLDAKTGLGITIVNGMGMPMQGIAMLMDVVKKDPKNLKANMSLGIFAIKSGQFDKAIARFNDIIAIKPSPDAYFYLATSYESLGKNKEAIDAYLQSKKLAGNLTLSKFIDRKVAELQEKI